MRPINATRLSDAMRFRSAQIASICPNEKSTVDNALFLACANLADELEHICSTCLFDDFRERTGTVQGVSENGLFRGAQAMADYLNSHLIGGKKLTRAAVYRMVEDAKIPVIRLGEKRSEIWARKSDLDRMLGCGP